jgi:hypothetical protein
MKGEYWFFAFLFLFVSGVMITQGIWNYNLKRDMIILKLENLELMQKAIENDCAGYNKKTGELEWYTNE